MLEIVLEITVCLIIAAIIGFAIGYILAKSTQKDHNNTLEKSVEAPLEEIKISNNEEIFKALEEIETLEKVEEETKEEETKEEETKEEETKEEEVTKPELFTTPLQIPQDNLSSLKGIGPKLEEKLNDEGIFYFNQIANWNDANMKWLEINTTFAPRAKKDLWIVQAKELLV
jgi:predicted flap endonuclease-1-like 5' DNA nuclease